MTEIQRLWTTTVLTIVLLGGSFGCSSQPQSSAPTQTPSPSATAPSMPTPLASATADLSTPEGPLQVIFQAAKTKNYELYRSAYSDVVPPEAISQKRFQRFSQKIAEESLEIIPGFEKVSDTEAIVKWKNTKRNRERSVRVRKIGDRWLIVSLEGQPKRKKRQSEDTDL